MKELLIFVKKKMELENLRDQGQCCKFCHRLHLY